MEVCRQSEGRDDSMVGVSRIKTMMRGLKTKKEGCMRDE